MLAEAPPRKYRIERYLTEGGMGAIYLGKKLGAGGFEKAVVLKQLLPEYTSRPEFRDLFFREAKISATLDHVNIVRTFDLVSSEDALFIVMEYVQGADLRTITWRARLKRRPLSPQAVLHVALEILAGLAYAHGRQASTGAPLGIIHRDVSPSNILCSAQGDVKLSDFGIAKATTFSSVFYRVRGKVGYMSPEQAHNRILDGRSDLFSLAVCLFESLTGERLYAGDLQTPPEIIYGQRVPPLSVKRPDLPEELESVMATALAHDPDGRFQDARAFAEALREVARRHGLLFSAPQLAAELVSILGPKAETWSQESGAGSETEELPLGRALEGKEVTSLRDEDRAVGKLPSPRAGSAPSVPARLPRSSASPLPSGSAGAPSGSSRRAAPVFHPTPVLLPAPPEEAPPSSAPAAAASLPRSRRLLWAASLITFAIGVAAGGLWAVRRGAAKAPAGPEVEATHHPVAR
jgi:eukaryotic-like serine/threonine-protein kinase